MQFTPLRRVFDTVLAAADRHVMGKRTFSHEIVPEVIYPGMQIDSYALTPIGITRYDNPANVIFDVLNKAEPLWTAVRGGPLFPGKIAWDAYVEDPVGEKTGKKNYRYWDWFL